MQNFTFKIHRDSDNQEVEVNPRFGNKYPISYSREQGQMFKRAKAPAFDLLDNDFDFINNESIETEFTYSIFKGDSSTPRYTGVFYKTDCKPFRDERRLTVNHNPKDSYTNIVDKRDDEFDILELNPPLKPIEVQRPAIFQIFDNKNGILSNHEGAVYWETESSNVGLTDEELENFHFFKNEFYSISKIGLDPDVSGLYLRDNPPVPGASGFSATHLTKPYLIQRTEGFTRFDIINTNTDERIYTAFYTESSSVLQVEFEKIGDEQNTAFHFFVEFRTIFSRLITNATQINGTATELLSGNDIVATNSYKRALPIETTNFALSTNINTDPDQYGFVKESNCGINTNVENYYHKPENDNITETLYPIAKSGWGCFSLWFYLDDTLRTLRADAATTETVNGYPMVDVLKKLLNELDENILFEANADHSEFLNSINPIDSTDVEWFFIPLESVFSSNNAPQVRNLIKFSEIEKLLWHTWRCRWDIYDQNKFRIEQIKFHLNGGDYDNPRVVFNQSTPLGDGGFNWGVLEDDQAYLKQSMPRQYVTKWKSEQSKLFDGYPVEIKSRFVNKGLRNDETIASFVSDYNFFQVSSEIDRKGFFLSAVTRVENDTDQRQMLTLAINIDGQDYNLQNGLVSNVYLHKTFHLYGQPAPNLVINDSETTALMIKRIFQAKIKFNSSNDWLGLDLGLIETQYGQAEILSITEELETNEKELLILYEAT